MSRAEAGAEAALTARSAELHRYVLQYLIECEGQALAPSEDMCLKVVFHHKDKDGKGPDYELLTAVYAECVAEYAGAAGRKRAYRRSPRRNLRPA